jgi:O-antigen biosynthesis protein
MRLKKVAHKALGGARILKNEGPLSLSIKSLQKLQARKQVKPASLQQPIHVKVKYEDALQAGLGKKLPIWKGTKAEHLTFNWVMPAPGKGSGGHMNIFRFIQYLESAGHTCRIYLYAVGGKGSVGAIVASMGDSYPKIKALSTMQWLEDGQEMAPADGLFATSWETAYPLFNSKLSAQRFYFVQDFEPYFYPAGSLYTLAENTYKFGFFGTTAGGWLAKKLNRDYGMQTEHFDFGADENLYSFNNTGQRKEVFFYARPYTERRGFELGILALDLFHQKHPDYIINLAGWDVSDYQIPFPYNNLKTLELSQLNALYNKCAVGLVLSFTNMSLLPLELLGSGTIPVVNQGENNSLVSDNPYIAYAESDPVSLAGALSDIVSKKDLPVYAKKAAASVKSHTWDDSGRKFVEVVERQTRKNG